MESLHAAENSGGPDWIGLLLEEQPCEDIAKDAGALSGVTDAQLACVHPSGTGAAMDPSVMEREPVSGAVDDLDATFLDSLLNDPEPFDFPDLPALVPPTGGPANSGSSHDSTAGAFGRDGSGLPWQAPTSSGSRSPTYPASPPSGLAADASGSSPAGSVRGAIGPGSPPIDSAGQPAVGGATSASPSSTSSGSGQDNTGGGRAPRSSKGGSKAGSSADDADDEERKRQTRMQRNRESAQLSRQRKKMQVGELEGRCNELSSQNKYLQGLVAQLGSENAALRAQLVQVCQATNTPLPAAAAGPPPGAAPHHGGVPPGAYYAYPGYGLPPGAVPMFGATPKVPIQKLPPQRPAPAPRPAPAAAAKRGGGGSGGGGAKKAKTAAGAGSALLALCALFAFAGPAGWPVTSPAAPHSGASDGAAAEPYAATLLAAVAANATAGGAWDASAASGGGRDNGGAWEAAGNGTALALAPSSTELETTALQRLMDASGVALVWDPAIADSSPVVAELMPEWTNFPALLGSNLRADGFLSPIGCEKVFSVDASTLPDHAKLQRKMASHLSSLQGFRGRAVPLPPSSAEAGGAGPEGAHAPLAGAERKPRIGAEPGDKGGGLEGTVVSLVLPARKEGLAGGALAALDRIFVVVLQQSAVYATYSCTLPKLPMS